MRIKMGIGVVYSKRTFMRVVCIHECVFKWACVCEHLYVLCVCVDVLDKSVGTTRLHFALKSVKFY